MQRYRHCPQKSIPDNEILNELEELQSSLSERSPDTRAFGEESTLKLINLAKFMQSSATTRSPLFEKKEKAFEKCFKDTKERLKEMDAREKKMAAAQEEIAELEVFLTLCHRKFVLLG